MNKPTYEELAAQVELLRMAIMSNCYDDTSTSGQRLMELANTTPAACLAQVRAEEFGHGYYQGFIDGGKHQEQVDLNLKTAGGLASFSDEAMRCSEIAEGEYANRIRKEKTNG